MVFVIYILKNIILVFDDFIMLEIRIRVDNKDDDIWICVMDIDGYCIINFKMEDYEKYFCLMIGWKVRNDDVIISVYFKLGLILC